MKNTVAEYLKSVNEDIVYFFKDTFVILVRESESGNDTFDNWVSIQIIAQTLKQRLETLGFKVGDIEYENKVFEVVLKFPKEFITNDCDDFVKLSQKLPEWISNKIGLDFEIEIIVEFTPDSALCTNPKMRSLNLSNELHLLAIS